MDPVIVLIVIAVVLLAYQLFLSKDYDKLDAFGHEVYNMKQRREINS
jgi:Tfp pilus assembly protein PilO